MSYQYSEERPRLFTDEGQRLFLAIRDQTHRLLKAAGAARSNEMTLGQSGDSWLMLACIDRVVELNEIRELTDSSKVRGQDRVFVKI